MSLNGEYNYIRLAGGNGAYCMCARVGISVYVYMYMHVQSIIGCNNCMITKILLMPTLLRPRLLSSARREKMEFIGRNAIITQLENIL